MNDRGNRELLRSIRVGFDLDYETACERTSPWEFQDRLKELGAVLAHRRGWHFDLANDLEPIWSWGAFGASQFNITLNENGEYSCFDYGEDSIVVVESVEGVEAWLLARADGADPINETQREWMKADDWWLLRNYNIDVDVTWADEQFVGTVSQYPDEPIISPTIGGVLSNARESLCLLFGAPLDLAPGVRVSATLDSDATSRLVDIA